MRTLRILLITAMLGAPLAATPARAANGCRVEQSVQLGTFGFVFLHNCRYQATGPGVFTAVTASGWRISISKDGGATFPIVVARSRGLSQPVPDSMGATTVYAPGTGTIPSVAGDWVDVAIYPEGINVPDAGRLSLPFGGYAEAHDA